MTRFSVSKKDKEVISQLINNLENIKKQFYLSYPENNAQGIMYEPWHWHYENI